MSGIVIDLIDTLRILCSCGDGDTPTCIYCEAREEITLLRRTLVLAQKDMGRLKCDADRYRYLRSRNLDTITSGGVFAGMTPRNVVLNGQDLDQVIDEAMAVVSRPVEMGPPDANDSPVEASG